MASKKDADEEETVRKRPAAAPLVHGEDEDEEETVRKRPAAAPMKKPSAAPMKKPSAAELETAEDNRTFPLLHHGVNFIYSVNEIHARGVAFVHAPPEIM